MDFGGREGNDGIAVFAMFCSLWFKELEKAI